MKQENKSIKAANEPVANTACSMPNQESAYYRAKLIAFMADAHPRYVEQNQLTPLMWGKFLSTRAEAAEQDAFTSMFLEIPLDIADEDAIMVLLAGLRFSRHKVVLEILDTVYPNIKQSLNSEVIYAIEDACADIFDKYRLGDDYVSDPLYESLLRDLQPCIHQFLMDNI